ncbi:MAG: beta-propeller fold lactonase family protein [Ignavibacteriota bacterium]
MADAWLGLTFTPKGDRVYVGGGSKASVFEFTFADGTLTASRTFPVASLDKVNGHDMIGDVAFSPDGRLLYAADLYHDSVVVINPQSGMLIQRIRTGRRPYRILFPPRREVVLRDQLGRWHAGPLRRVERERTGARTARHASHRYGVAATAGSPMRKAMKRSLRRGCSWPQPIPQRLFGRHQCAKDLSVVERINISMTPRQPLGMTPSALALTPDGKRLFVVCSDGNVAAAVDVSNAVSHRAGIHPHGVVSHRSARASLRNAGRAQRQGRAIVPKSRGGRIPASMSNPFTREFASPDMSPILQTGTASWIAPFTDEQLSTWTQKAMSLSAYRDTKLDYASTFPPQIQHVLYIEKENRTYDQVLGDMKEGNGDPSLVQFGEDVTTESS